MKNLLRAIHDSGRGRVGTSLQSALDLLLTAGLVFVLMTATACDCNDDGMDDCSGMVVDWAKYQQWSANRAKQLDESPDFKAKITDEDQEAAGRALPGERVHHALGGQIVGSPAPTAVTYTWSPPARGEQL